MILVAAIIPRSLYFNECDRVLSEHIKCSYVSLIEMVSCSMGRVAWFGYLIIVVMKCRQANPRKLSIYLIGILVIVV